MLPYFPHIIENAHPRTCTACKGRGTHQTKVWQEFWAQAPEVCRQLFNDMKALRKWFTDRDAMTPLNPMRPDILLFPASETDCSQCRGTGLYPAH